MVAARGDGSMHPKAAIRGDSIEARKRVQLAAAQPVRFMAGPDGAHVLVVEMRADGRGGRTVR